MNQHAARVLTFLCLAGSAVMAQVPPRPVGVSYGSIVVPTFVPPTMQQGDPTAYWISSLGLDTAQQASLKAILADQQTSTDGLKAKLDSARVALGAGAKANSSDSEIDRLATDLGALFSQAVAVQAKAYARFYALLSPEQKQKFDALAVLPDGAALSVVVGGGPGATVKQ